MAGAPINGSLFDQTELTTSNGTGADGTGSGPWHREVVQVEYHARLGWQWVLRSVNGTANITFYVTAGPVELACSNKVPLPNTNANPMWALDGNYTFLSDPAGGPATAIPLQVADHGLTAVLVEIEVLADLEDFDLYYAVAED